MASESSYDAITPALTAAYNKFLSGTFTPNRSVPAASNAGMFSSPNSPYNSLSDQILDSFRNSRLMAGAPENPYGNYNMARYAFAGNYKGGEGTWYDPKTGTIQYSATGGATPTGQTPVGMPAGGTRGPLPGQPGGAVIPPYTGPSTSVPVGTGPAGTPTIPIGTGGTRTGGGGGSLPTNPGTGPIQAPGARTGLFPTSKAAAVTPVSGTRTPGLFPSAPSTTPGATVAQVQGLQDSAGYNSSVPSVQSMVDHFMSLPTDRAKADFFNAVEQASPKLGASGAPTGTNLGSQLDMALRATMGESAFKNWMNANNRNSFISTSAGLPSWLTAVLK